MTIDPIANSLGSQVPESPKTSEPSSQERFAIIIDDEPANRDFLQRLIEQANFTTLGAGTCKQAREHLTSLKQTPSLIIVDQELPDMQGIELLKQLRVSHPQTLLVMATMHDDLPTIRQAFESGCNVYLVKPHGFMELYKRLSAADGDWTTLDNIIIDRMGVRAFRP